MMCPACPAAGFLGGAVGSFIGVKSPSSLKGKVLSTAITASLVSLTIIGLKVFAKISVCEGLGLSFRGMKQALFKTLIMGAVYSLGVNYLLNRFLYTKPEAPSCCRKIEQL